MVLDTAQKTVLRVPTLRAAAARFEASRPETATAEPKAWADGGAVLLPYLSCLRLYSTSPLETLYLKAKPCGWHCPAEAAGSAEPRAVASQPAAAQQGQPAQLLDETSALVFLELPAFLPAAPQGRVQLHAPATVARPPLSFPLPERPCRSAPIAFQAASARLADSQFRPASLRSYTRSHPPAGAYCRSGPKQQSPSPEFPTRIRSAEQQGSPSSDAFKNVKLRFLITERFRCAFLQLFRKSPRHRVPCRHFSGLSVDETVA